MAAYYSILSVLIRPELQEKISVGLLLFDEQKIFFNYSKNKQLACKSLLPDDGYALLKDSIKNIENKAINENDLLGSKSGKQLTLQDEMLLNSFSPSYVSYLSRYNNNILSFTDPKQIDIEASNAVFKKLFSKFIDASEAIESGVPKLRSIEVFKDVNRPRLINHFNIDQKVTSKEIQNLIMPVKVDLLGQNGMPVYVQTIDMDRRAYDIEYDIGVLLSLHAAFDQNKTKSQGFVMAQEPSKSDKEQYDIWSELSKSSLFEYIDVSEGEKIIEYAEKYNVHPLIQGSNPIDEEETPF